jgi:hypothetical protein
LDPHRGGIKDVAVIPQLIQCGRVTLYMFTYRGTFSAAYAVFCIVSGWGEPLPTWGRGRRCHGGPSAVNMVVLHYSKYFYICCVEATKQRSFCGSVVFT